MRRWLMAVAVAALVALAGCGWIGPRPTPEPPTATLMPPPATWTMTPTVRPTVTPRATAMPPNRATVTPRPTRTPKITPTATETPQATISPTPTPTVAPTPFAPGRIRRGRASQYAAGVFERVVAQHVAMGYWETAPDMAGYAGYAATESCDHYRSGIWLRPGEGEPWGLYLVADCAGDGETVAWMQANNILVEVDAATYARWRAAGYWTRRGMPVEWAGGAADE